MGMTPQPGKKDGDKNLGLPPQKTTFFLADIINHLATLPQKVTPPPSSSLQSEPGPDPYHRGLAEALFPAWLQQVMANVNLADNLLSLEDMTISDLHLPFQPGILATILLTDNGNMHLIASSSGLSNDYYAWNSKRKMIAPLAEFLGSGVNVISVGANLGRSKITQIIQVLDEESAGVRNFVARWKKEGK